MRTTRVAAKPRAPVRPRAAWPLRETAGMLLAACVLAIGFWRVYAAKTPALDAAATGLARNELLLLRRGAAASEIAPFLPDGKHAAEVDRSLVDSAPPNVGAIRGRLFSSDQFARIKPAFAVRTPDQFRSAFRRRVLLFFAVFALAHVLLAFIGFRGDPYMLPLAFLLSAAGIILMASLRDPVRDLMIFSDSAGAAAAGCALLAAIAAGAHFLALRSQGLLRVPPPAGRLLDLGNALTRGITKRGDIAFVASAGLSLILLVFGTGPGESDARVRLWFFQPVEVIRFLLVLFLAGYFAARWEYLRELKEKRINARIDLPRLDHTLPVMAAVAIAIAFFFLQKDLGPAVILAGLFLCLYAVARARVGLVLAAAAMLAATGWLAYRIGYPRIAATRIGMWLEPWNNGLARGEQVVHGLWAMATGGLFGTGLGKGQPEVVPAAHTDLVLAALAEETGFVGLFIVLAAFAFLVWRGLRIALRAATDYDFFLALGLTLALALQAAFIAGGVTGILPLSGVVTPFLSYGGTAMLVNFACLAILLAISAKTARTSLHPRFRRPVLALAGVLASFTGLVAARAAWVQVVKADNIVASGTLVQREDGSHALLYNPRLLAIARQIPRGTIFDRNGLPLATGKWEELEKRRSAYAALGIDIDRACSRSDSRHYPFGPAMFHMLGDLRTRARWSASNAAFEEKLSRAGLQGFNDRETLVTMTLPRTGKQVRVIRYDYSELVPLLRARMDPNNDAVRKVLEAPRWIRLTVDAAVQMRLTRAFSDHLRKNAWRSGAIAVVRPSTGELLAAVSLPLPAAEPADGDDSLDLARFGEYPPGSAFKLVTAIAALRTDPGLATKRYECVRLPDGRVGNRVRGRIIRDDVQDHKPHGSVDLRSGIVHSCNAFFSQLGTYDVSAERLLAAANFFNIETARPNTARALDADLPQAAYGQAQVLVTPLRMARVAGAIAAGGRLPALRTRDGVPLAQEHRVLDASLAAILDGAMRGVVTSGTGREAARSAVPIAGKTGTAELAHAPSHGWFAGYAPAGAPVDQRIAFAIVVANARYGGRAAAPFAPQLVDAARELMQQRPRVPAEESQ